MNGLYRFIDRTATYRVNRIVMQSFADHHAFNCNDPAITSRLLGTETNPAIPMTAANAELPCHFLEFSIEIHSPSPLLTRIWMPTVCGVFSAAAWAGPCPRPAAARRQPPHTLFPATHGTCTQAFHRQIRLTLRRLPGELRCDEEMHALQDGAQHSLLNRYSVLRHFVLIYLNYVVDACKWYIGCR